MQIPRLFKAGRSAHAFIWWLPVALLTTILWMGCGKSADKEKPAGGESPAPSTGQPVAAPEQGVTGGGETAAGQVPNVGETSTPKENTEPVVTPVVTAPVVKAEPAQALPANAKHLPADCWLIVSFKAGQMLEKGGYKEFVKSPVYQELVDEDTKAVLEILTKDPVASGIDLAQPIHVFGVVDAPAKDNQFSQPMLSVGIVASVKNAKAVEATLNKLLIMQGYHNVKRGKGEGYKTIMPMPAERGEEATAVANSKDALILFARNNPEYAAKIPGLLADRFAGRKSLAKDSKAAALLRSEYDVAAWMDYGHLWNVATVVAAEDKVIKVIQDLTKGLEYTVAARFEPGSVDVDMIAYSDSELFKGFSKGGPNKNLLKLVPNNAILAGAEAINMKPLRTMMIKQVLPLLKNGDAAEMTQEIENMLGLTIEDVLTIPKGDFLLVFDGMEMGGEIGIMPQFLLGMTIDNRANFNKLLNNPAVQGFLPSLNALGMQIAQNENAFFICSQNHGPTINAGKAQKPAAPRHLKLLGGDAGGYIQFDAVRALIQKLGEGDPEAQMMAQVLGKFDEATYTGTFGDDGKQGAYAKLTFKDKKTNGLKQLMDLILQIATMVD